MPYETHYQRGRKVTHTGYDPGLPLMQCIDCNTRVFNRSWICDGCDESICYNCRQEITVMDSAGRYTTSWCKTCFGILNDADLTRKPTTNKVKGAITVLDTGKKHTHYKFVNTKYMTWHKSLTEGEPFDIEMSGDTFFQFIGWFMDTEWDEIAGEFVWDEKTNQIIWAAKIARAKEEPGHVTSYSAETTNQALNEVGRVPNGQWHTHPGFSSFHSGEDKTNMMEFVEDAMLWTPVGFHLFIVHNGLNWNVCRIDWKDGLAVSKRSGTIIVNGVPLKFRRTKRVYKYKKYEKPETSAASYVQPRPWHGNGKVQKVEQVVVPPPNKDDKQIAIYDAKDDPNWSFRGYWSNDDKDYEYLFDILGVDHYNWKMLHDVIGEIYGLKYYRSVVDFPSIWGQLLTEDENEPASQII